MEASEAATPTNTRTRASGKSVRVFEDDGVRVAISGNPDDPGVFLCFTGVGGGVGGVQVEEFVGSTRLPGYFAIYIADKRRAWYNWDAQPLLDILQPYVAGKSIVTIGNSMGGFGAIWMAGVLKPVRTCLAFAAQYSVHPEIVPAENRWLDYRQAIKDWRVPSLLNAFSPETRFWTFNGGRDAEHWSRFPHSENCSHYLARDAGHDVARTLKKAGILSDVIKDCIEGVDPFGRIAEAGVQIERITAETGATLHRAQANHRGQPAALEGRLAEGEAASPPLMRRKHNTWSDRLLRKRRKAI
jgi:hypothetical protein